MKEYSIGKVSFLMPKKRETATRTIPIQSFYGDDIYTFPKMVAEALL